MNIALVAHDGRKREMLEWVRYNALTLAKHTLYATGTTGRLISEELNNVAEEIIKDNDTEEAISNSKLLLTASKNVTRLLSGPIGGDQEAGAMIAEGKLDMLIFFCDNLVVQGHQNDVSALGRLASLYNIAYATNRTTADMILTSSLFDNKDYERILPHAIESYTNRNLQ